MIRPKVVLLIFVSGKIVLTGAKVREEIYQAFNQIYSVLVGEWLRIACIGRVVADPVRWMQNSKRPERAASMAQCLVEDVVPAPFAFHSCSSRQPGCASGLSASSKNLRTFEFSCYR